MVQSPSIPISNGSQKNEMPLPITQKHGTGCAVACVAYILNRSYDAALKLFSKPNQAVIAPAESGFQKKLPGKAQWVIYPTRLKKAE